MMTRFYFLKHVQHFDVDSFDWKKENEKRKAKMVQSTTFSNTCNITKHFEKLTSATELIINTS